MERKKKDKGRERETTKRQGTSPARLRPRRSRKKNKEPSEEKNRRRRPRACSIKREKQKMGHVASKHVTPLQVVPTHARASEDITIPSATTRKGGQKGKSAYYSGGTRFFSFAESSSRQSHFFSFLFPLPARDWISDSSRAHGGQGRPLSSPLPPSEVVKHLKTPRGARERRANEPRRRTGSVRRGCQKRESETPFFSFRVW